MPRRRSAPDHESLQRVLLLGGVLLGVAGIAIAVWGLLSDRKGVVAGVVLLLFAAACLVVSRDDGTGQWCPECVTRNAADADACESCGHSLG
jgi:hypothetical protein